MVQLAEGETFEVKRLLDTTTCAECHGEIAAQWKGSMHHRSSFNNPFYQDVFDRFVADNGRQKGRFCGGCHDTALMFDDTILAEVRPEDPKAHAGISCAVCHGVTEATTEGNASYTLTTSPIPLPKEGDEPSLVAHRARVGMAAHVPMVLAAAWLFLHPEQYGLQFPQVSSTPATLALVHASSINELAICLGNAGNRDGWFRPLRNLNPRYEAHTPIAAGTALQVPDAVLPLYRDRCMNAEIAAQARDIASASRVQARTVKLASYTVRSGDTLAAIARKHRCGNPRSWPRRRQSAPTPSAP